MQRKLMAVCVILFAASGCTVYHSNRFRVVDASDQRPIAGVRAEGSEHMFQPNTIGWPVRCCFPTGSVNSDADGLVQFDAAGANTVTFSKEGYEPCTVVADWPGWRPGKDLFKLHTFPWEDRWTPIIALQPSRHN